MITSTEYTNLEKPDAPEMDTLKTLAFSKGFFFSLRQTKERKTNHSKRSRPRRRHQTS
jgi:hypothetical protein